MQRPTQLLITALCLAAIFACIPALATEPTINLVQPTGAQRGTQADITIGGLRLNDAQQIIFYEPGLEVTKLEAGKPAEVKLQVKIAPESRLGMHAFRVRTATGVSNRLTPEGTTVLARRGTIRRTRDGAFIFVFDADAEGLSDPPLLLLP